MNGFEWNLEGGGRRVTPALLARGARINAELLAATAAFRKRIDEIFEDPDEDEA